MRPALSPKLSSQCLNRSKKSGGTHLKKISTDPRGDPRSVDDQQISGASIICIH